MEAFLVSRLASNDLKVLFFIDKIDIEMTQEIKFPTAHGKLEIVFRQFH